MINHLNCKKISDHQEQTIRQPNRQECQADLHVISHDLAGAGVKDRVVVRVADRAIRAIQTHRHHVILQKVFYILNKNALVIVVCE